MNKLTAFISGAALLFALAVSPALASQSSLALAPSAGTAAAQTISVPSVTSMSDITGTDVAWIVGTGLTDTGPTTMSINGLPAVPIDRMNSGTTLPLGGDEMPAGKLVRAFYDGTELVLETDYTGPDPVGSSKVINYSSPDPGYVLENGQCLSETAEPALFAKYGTQYNTQDGCSGSNFGIDNKKGRIVAAADSMGGTAQGILTNCASTIGATCGAQGSVVAQANLTNFALSASSTANSTANSTITFSPTDGSAQVGTGSLPAQTTSGSGDVPAYNVYGLTSAMWSVSTSVTTTVSTSVTSGGSSTPLSLVQPTKIVYYEAKL